MNNSNISEIVNIYSAAHASGIKIEMSPDYQPKADMEKRIIYLPILSEEIDEECIFVSLKHELSHLLYTGEFKPKDLLEKNILNSLEDLRIENIFGNEYPGAKKGFYKNNVKMRDKISERGVEKLELINQILIKLMFNVMKIPFEIKDEGKKIFDELKKNFQEEIDNFYSLILSYDDVKALSVRIYDFLKKYNKADGKEDKSGDKSKESGSKDKSKGSGSKDKKKSEEKLEEKEGDKGEEESDLDKSEEIKLDNEGDTEKELDTEVKEDLDKIVSEARHSEYAELVKELEKEIKMKEGDTHIEERIYVGKKLEQHIDSCSNIKLLSSKSYDSCKKIVNNDINKIKRILSKRLNEKCFQSFNPRKKKGGLDTSSLYMHSYDNRLFFNRSDKKEVGAAISFLIDGSGSMVHSSKSSGITMSKISWMITSVIAFLEGIKTIDKIKSEISMFTIDYKSKMVTAGGLKIFNLYHYIIKTFNQEKYNDSKRILDKLLKNDLNSKLYQDNYDRASVQSAYERLKSQKEKNKILFVFSDGVPDSVAASSGNHDTNLKKLIKKIQSEGIVKVIGIGLNSNSVKNYYSDNIVVNNLNELPKELEKILFKLI